MSKWTEIVDTDVAWACSQLSDTASVNQIVELIAHARGRAYAPVEVQAALARLAAKSAKRAHWEAEHGGNS